MKTMKCPACGAPLKIAAGRISYKCEYCDSVISLVSSEKQFGESESKDLLAKTLRDLVKPIKKYEKNQSKLEELEGRLEREKGLLNLFTYPQSGMFQFAIPSLTLLLTLIFIFEGTATVGGIFGSLLLMFLSFVVASSIVAYKHNEQAKKVAATTEEIETVKEANAKIEDTYDFSFIPIEICHSDCIAYMADCLDTGRAYDLNQAIAQCREEQRRKEEQRANNRKIDALEEHLYNLERQNRDLSERIDNRPVQITNVYKKETDLEDVVSAGITLAAGVKLLKNLKDWME